MKRFDYEKARNICERKDVIAAYGGLLEDWGWTSGQIYENGKYTPDEIMWDNSIWATPVIKYVTKNGKDYQEDCYIDDGVEEDEDAISRGKMYVSTTSAIFSNVE